jgi:chemotaxis protein methyltransferase CheR
MEEDLALSNVCRLVEERSGIVLGMAKREMARQRLMPRLRHLGLSRLSDYVRRLRADAAEVDAVVDLLTTHKTSFFREPDHFAFLTRHLSTVEGPLWCAGCSTGEEAYSLAIATQEADDARDVLATDVSHRVIEDARRGFYDDARMAGLSPLRRSRAFATHDGGWTIAPGVRERVHFAVLNLFADWPMRGTFAAIFCRNVMLYFDAPSRDRLVARFRDRLSPGGLLFVGRTETIDGRAGLRRVAPGVYTP